MDACVELGKYLLLKRLAVGGMGEVYLADARGAAGFHKPVVIKLLRQSLIGDPNFVEMFLDEARLAARLSHPHIAQTFDLGEADGHFYIAMEYVNGESLAELMRRAKEPPRLAHSLRIITLLLEALDYAHDATDEQGSPLHLVHRDVTPTNVLVTYHGTIKLLDFGIARATSHRHETEVGACRGQLGHMAPEQCSRKNVDHRADIFAVGSLLYTLAVGKRPYPLFAKFEDGVAAMREARFPPPRKVLATIPTELEAIILRAMQKDPSQRYQSAGAMVADLATLSSTLETPSSARELGGYVRSLFPDKERLARLADAASADARTLAEILDTARQAPPWERARASASGPSIRPRRSGPRSHAGSTVPERTFAMRRSRRLGRAWLIGAAAGAGIATSVIGVFSWASSDADGLPPNHPPAQARASVGGAAAGHPKSSPLVPAHGLLKIDADPGAWVREGPSPLGVTPLEVELPAGAHELVLENEGQRTWRMIRVTVRPNEVTTYSERRDAGDAPELAGATHVGGRP